MSCFCFWGRSEWDHRRAGATDLIGLLAGTAWLLAAGLFGVWLLQLDPDSLLVTFPSPLLVASSFAAMVAAFATLLLAGTLPTAWRDRTEGWFVRSLLSTLAVPVFALLTVALWQRGLLPPWS